MIRANKPKIDLKMNNKEILAKAIEKAIAGGWKHPNGWTYLASYKKPAPFNSVQFADESGEVWHMPIEALIFNHDFAKALWGKNLIMYLTVDVKKPSKSKDVSVKLKGQSPNYIWQYHLQQMVIADAPIAYLGDNI